MVHSNIYTKHESRPQSGPLHNLGLSGVPSNSCHSRVIRNQQYLYPKFLPTAVVKLLQYSGSRVEHKDGFLILQMICIMVQNGEAFIWIFGFALKSVGVVITRLTDSSLKQDVKGRP